MKTVIPPEVALAFSEADLAYMQTAFVEARRRRGVQDRKELAAMARALIQTFQREQRDWRKLFDAAMKATV